MCSINDKIPLVSISCLTYNHVNYIEEALNGFMMQKTNFKFEVLIHDDASTDGTEEIIRDFERLYPSIIKPLYEETNQWVKGRKGSAVFNFPRAKGKYIALCEGDDYWTDPLKLQKQVDFLEENLDYGICFHDVKIFDQEKNMFTSDYITRDVEETTNVIELAKGNYIHTPSVMLRNDFVVPNWFFKSPIGDWPLYMLVIKNKKVKKLMNEMAVYRIHSTSVWSGLSQEIRNEKTKISVKLVYDNLELSKKVLNILRSRIKIEKNKSFVLRFFTKK